MLPGFEDLKKGGPLVKIRMGNGPWDESMWARCGPCASHLIAQSPLDASFRIPRAHEWTD